jgi:putative polyhydroxyalkanoate system protein
MATININKKYTKSVAEVKEQLEELVTDLADRYELKCQWTSDHTVTFKRSGADGEISIADGNVNFKMKLGFVLSALKGKVERRVNSYLDEHLL